MMAEKKNQQTVDVEGDSGTEDGLSNSGGTTEKLWYNQRKMFVLLNLAFSNLSRTDLFLFCFAFRASAR